MLERVMRYCKNFFIRSKEVGDYQIVADGIQGKFSDTYLAGQYICIESSYLNDGVYKLASVSATKLTVEETLTPENTDDYVCVYGLNVPNSFIQLVSDISAYNSTVRRGIKSESQGERSVTYGSGGSSNLNDNTWQRVFANDLSPFMNVYSDKQTFVSGYNIYTKEWC